MYFLLPLFHAILTTVMVRWSTLHIVESASEQAIRERLAQDPWEASELLRTETVERWRVLLDRDAAARPDKG